MTWTYQVTPSKRLYTSSKILSVGSEMMIKVLGRVVGFPSSFLKQVIPFFAAGLYRPARKVLRGRKTRTGTLNPLAIFGIDGDGNSAAEDIDLENKLGCDLIDTSGKAIERACLDAHFFAGIEVLARSERREAPGVRDLAELMDRLARVWNLDEANEQIRLQHVESLFGIEPREDIAGEERQQRAHLPPLHTRLFHIHRHISPRAVASKIRKHLLFRARLHMQYIPWRGVLRQWIFGSWRHKA